MVIGLRGYLHQRKGKSRTIWNIGEEMKFKDRDREQILRNFLTQLMGNLDALRLTVDTFLNDGRLWKSKATKTERKKIGHTK